MRNSSYRASAIRDWRCMQRARFPHGSGRSTARGFSGPIRSAPGCSTPPMARHLRKRLSGPRIHTGARAGGRTMPLVERLQRLVEGADTPMAALTRDGLFVGASDAARSLLGFRNLSDVGLDGARSDALRRGRVETAVGIGHLILQRVGTGADVGLIALIAPGATHAAHVRHVAPASPETAGTEPAHQPVAPTRDLPMPDYERPAMTGEAPAEFALIDEFADQPAEAAVEQFSTDALPEPDIPRAEVSATTVMPDSEVHQGEPSPYVEAVADEPAPACGEDPPSKDLPSAVDPI